MNKEEFVQTVLTIVVFILIFLMLSWVGFFDEQAPVSTIDSFDECVAAGYPVMESYPRQCRVPDGDVFVEIITQNGEDDVIMCIQVITAARNNETGEVRDFPTPCDVPDGWEIL